MHLSESAEWFTPDVILDRARKVLGRIDLDPASCEEANKRVGARIFFDKRQNGLEQDWGRYAGTVFLNPPGDKRGILPKAFWNKLMAMESLTQGIYVGFSLEQLRYLEGIGDFFKHTVAILRKRVCFVRPDGTIGTSPAHGSFVVHISNEGSEGQQEFRRQFSDISNVIF